MIVTSFSEIGYTKYGKRFIESFLKHWADEKLVVYVEAPIEDFEHERVEFRDLFAVDLMPETLDMLKDAGMIYQGRKKVGGTKGYDYRYDAYRFCRKVFAMADAGRGHTEKYAWMDADVVFHADVPAGFIDSLLPDDKFMAYLARPWSHCETGFVAFNPAYPNHDDFLDLMVGTYATGAFKYLGEWHDCYVLDYLLAATAMETVNLAEGLTVEHVFINTILGKYCDHLKGPARKDHGRSPQSEALLDHGTDYWNPNVGKNKVQSAVKDVVKAMTDSGVAVINPKVATVDEIKSVQETIQNQPVPVSDRKEG